jgi:uncharacterized membrane protein YdbT with pleckstrin-like domain
MLRLLAGESMILPPVGKHWVVLATRAFWPAVLTVLALGAVNLAPFVPSCVRVLLTLLVLVCAIVAAGYVWLTWRAATITVTDQRVILEEGVLVRNSTVIPLNRVQDVSTRQAVLGRILDYGTLTIDTAGHGMQPTERFRDVVHPGTLRDQIFVLADHARRAGL